MRKRSFTLVELLIASGVLTLIMATLVPLAMTIFRNYMVNQVLSNFESEAALAREWIKRDLACSSASDFILHPEGNTAGILAVGMPVLNRPDGVTGLPVAADGSIAWTDTVIYHLFTNDTGETELRRTVFAPRMELTATQRQQQLESVALNGNGASTFNASNATTQTMLTNVVEHNITSGSGEIDTYGAARKNKLFSFGTWILSPGYNTFEFRVTGKNALSTGYGFAFDRFMVSATGEDADAECLVPAVAAVGATASSQNMSLYSGWSNNAQLNFPASSVGNYLKLNIYNDSWIESSFSDDEAVINDTEVSFDSSLGEIVCQLRGNELAWEAVGQTHAMTPAAPDVNYGGCDVRVIISGANINGLGENISLERPRAYVTLRSTPSTTSTYLHVKEAYIMELDADYNGVPGTVTPLTFKSGWHIDNSREIYSYGLKNAPLPDSVWILNGYTAVSDWFNLPISPSKNYLVSFHVGNFSSEWNSVTGTYEYVYYYTDPAVWSDASGRVNSYVYYNPAPAASMAGVADWRAIDPALIEGKSKLLAVENVVVSYPASGSYQSKIVDTTMSNPEYVAVNWRQQVVGADRIRIKVRAGDQPDLSDATGWSMATTMDNPTGTNTLSSMRGRYVQWLAEFTSASPYTSTPKLRDVTLRWLGKERGAEVTTYAEQAPNRGKVALFVNGQEPQPSQLRMEFTIGEYVLDKEYVKNIAIEVTPRN